MIKGCFADGPFSFAGEHYTITDYDGLPKPVQQPLRRSSSAAGRRILALAGREADIVGLAPRALRRLGGEVDPRRRSDHRRGHGEGRWVREAAGDRFDDLEFNIYRRTSADVTTMPARRRDLRGAAAGPGGRGLRSPNEELLDSPHIFIGSIDGLVDKFRMLRERLGVSSLMVGGIDELAPVVERLAGT